MFCKYCGRQLKEGEVCTCRQPKENPVPEKEKKSKKNQRDNIKQQTIKTKYNKWDKTITEERN